MATLKNTPPISNGTTETVKVLVKNDDEKTVGAYAYFNDVEDCWIDANSGKKYEKVVTWKPIKKAQ